MSSQLSGTVYWITGLSGAGKTTIGKELHRKLIAQGDPAVFLDGDELREVFGNTFGHTRTERLTLALAYSRLSRLLSSQGFDIICSTISMFHEVRDWNRLNIPRYCEVYLKVPSDVLHARDQKGLYSGHARSGTGDVVGLDQQLEEPTNPDLAIESDGTISVEEIVQRILDRKQDDDRR